jgi:heptosyltransferase-2
MSRLWGFKARESRPPGVPAGPAEPAAILVRTPNWLGDLMVSTAFLRAALHRFPQARLDLIVRAGFEALPLPRRGDILPFDKRRSGAGAFGRELRARGYSHFFVLPPSFSSAWMAFRSGAPVRIGYAGEGRAPLLRPALAHRHPPRSVHLAQEYFALLAPWMEVDPARFPAGLDLPAGWAAAHLPAALRGALPYVALAPGAEYGPAKRWPVEHYRRTAGALAAAGWRVVVTGTPKEQTMGEAIASAAPGALNLCGATDLQGFVALLAGARLLISNDSGAMHVGAALGLPQIALFGPTNPAWTAPLNPRARLHYRAEPCSPCYARTCPLGHQRCLRELLPDAVIGDALEILAGSTDAAGAADP